MSRWTAPAWPGLLLAGWLLVPVPGSAETPPAKDPAPVTGGGEDDREPAAEIPAEWRDPAFDRYVDLQLLREALASQDLPALAEMAVQMAEGERILLRPHKAFRADKLLQITMV